MTEQELNFENETRRHQLAVNTKLMFLAELDSKARELLRKQGANKT